MTPRAPPRSTTPSSRLRTATCDRSLAPVRGDTRYEGFRISTFRKVAPTMPVIRNVVKNERLWADMTRFLQARLAREPVDIIHAQHVLSTVPSIRAGALTSTPVVATVRDYWP